MRAEWWSEPRTLLVVVAAAYGTIAAFGPTLGGPAVLAVAGTGS